MIQFCECDRDGWCRRYQRYMGGRLREVCAGVNCDLGTAAAFREQWGRETNRPDEDRTCRTYLLLKNAQAPGDAVVMTAAIRSLHAAHPGKYLTAVETPYPEVFAYNPDVTPIEEIPNALPLQMHYPAIHQSNDRGIHFMQGWCEHLSRTLGVPVPLATNRPHLYFDTPDPRPSDYWIVCSGGKRDLTNKLWGYERYQKVVRMLSGSVKFVQVGATTKEHPPLDKVIWNMVGDTSLRELFNWVRMARGVLCGVSLLMHVAAALGKPCVVIAGGREPVQWNAYPKQHYLHTVGELGCHPPRGNSGACWRSRTIPLGDSDTLDVDPCLHPIGDTPECMTVIKPEFVADLVRRIDANV